MEDNSARNRELRSPPAETPGLRAASKTGETLSPAGRFPRTGLFRLQTKKAAGQRSVARLSGPQYLDAAFIDGNFQLTAFVFMVDCPLVFGIVRSMIPRGRSLRRLHQHGYRQAAFDEGFGAKNRSTFFEGAHCKVRIKKSTGKCQWHPAQLLGQS